MYLTEDQRSKSLHVSKIIDLIRGKKGIDLRLTKQNYIYVCMCMFVSVYIFEDMKTTSIYVLLHFYERMRDFGVPPLIAFACIVEYHSSMKN